jgi:hypothetical protein
MHYHLRCPLRHHTWSRCPFAPPHLAPVLAHAPHVTPTPSLLPRAALMPPHAPHAAPTPSRARRAAPARSATPHVAPVPMAAPRAAPAPSSAPRAAPVPPTTPTRGPGTLYCATCGLRAPVCATRDPGGARGLCAPCVLCVRAPLDGFTSITTFTGAVAASTAVVSTSTTTATSTTPLLCRAHCVPPACHPSGSSTYSSHCDSAGGWVLRPTTLSVAKGQPGISPIPSSVSEALADPH